MRWMHLEIIVQDHLKKDALCIRISNYDNIWWLLYTRGWNQYNMLTAQARLYNFPGSYVTAPWLFSIVYRKFAYPPNSQRRLRLCGWQHVRPYKNFNVIVFYYAYNQDVSIQAQTRMAPTKQDVLAALSISKLIYPVFFVDFRSSSCFYFFFYCVLINSFFF